MRPFTLSDCRTAPHQPQTGRMLWFVAVAGACSVVTSAWGQSTSHESNTPTVPVGQTYKQFQFPLYQEGKLKATLSATEAKGITLNRAETTNLKIDLYDDHGKVTTTITSPTADLYMAEHKMRTKNTVLIERPDFEASAQICDFDLLAKKYLLRNNVKVTLKNFDTGLKAPGGTSSTPVATSSTSAPATTPPTPAQHPPATDDSLPSSPGTYATPNLGPTPPPTTATP